MYIVCELESDIDIARSLTGNKYKFQRVDSKWITPYIPVEGLPAHEIEEESLAWYSDGTKQYDIKKKEIEAGLDIMFDTIDELTKEVKNNFMRENILMGITQLGQTALVLEAMRDADYAMTNRSTTQVGSLLDAIPRSAPFLTDERLNKFKLDYYTKLAERL